MSVNISDVLDIVNNQNQWRGKESINLIASENVQSNAVKQIESNDFMGRYAEGHLNTAQEDSRTTKVPVTSFKLKAWPLMKSSGWQNVCRLMFVQ